MNNRIVRVFLVAVTLMMYWVTLFAFTAGLWITWKFGEPEFEQILFHFQFGIGDLLKADSHFIISFLIFCLIIPGVLAFLLRGYKDYLATVKTQGLREIRVSLPKFSFSLPQNFSDKFVLFSLFLFRIQFPFILFVFSMVFLFSKISLWDYLSNRENDLFIEQHYIPPQIISSPERKRNLVLLYIESLENTYADLDIFGENLLEAIEKKSSQAFSFTTFRQVFGTSWTMGSIVSTQCGIPLKVVTMFGGNQQGEIVHSFLPRVVCLGDILKAAGYKNIFMGGSSLSFAGKGRFFRDHGYEEIYGEEDWQEQGVADDHEWGLYDDKLFIFAKDKIRELEKQGSPYNFTILTVDTHHPFGFISPTCRRKGVKEFTEIIRCTSELLTDFISFMQENGYLENTNLILLGDHLSMVNSVHEKLLEEPDRTIFNRFFVPDELKKNRENIFHFSLFPTILYSLGFRFKNNRLGLGASGFGPLDFDFVLHTIDKKELKTRFLKRSEKYLDFWGIQTEQPLPVFQVNE